MSRINPAVQRRHKLRNTLQALVLLGGMALVLALSAWALIGPAALVWVAVLVVVVLSLRPKVSPAWVLRMYGAQRLPPAAAPELHRLVTALASRAGLRAVPDVYYVPSRMLNAFAVGRPHEAAVALTDGILRRLTPRELAGVLAHEISHIRSDDLWIMTLADAISRMTHALAYAGLILLALGLPLLAAGTAQVVLVAAALAAVPTIMTLLQLALSRSREYDADLEASTMTGDPIGLARALEKLDHHEGRIWERILVPHRRTPDPLLLRTHPPTGERVRRLHTLVPRETDWLPTAERLRLPAGYDRVSRPSRLRVPGIWW